MAFGIKTHIREYPNNTFLFLFLSRENVLLEFRLSSINKVNLFGTLMISLVGTNDRRSPRDCTAPSRYLENQKSPSVYREVCNN